MYLGVHCPTCEADCIPLGNGCCPFCDTHIRTGRVNKAMRADTTLARTQERNRRASAAFHERQRLARSA